MTYDNTVSLVFYTAVVVFMGIAIVWCIAIVFLAFQYIGYTNKQKERALQDKVTSAPQTTDNFIAPK